MLPRLRMRTYLILSGAVFVILCPLLPVLHEVRRCSRLLVMLPM